MKHNLIVTLAVGVSLAILSTAAQATPYDVQVSTVATNGTPFVTAEFTYAGPLSFDT